MIGDLDGDDKADLAIANYGIMNAIGTTVSVLRNTSTGLSLSFAPKVDFTVQDGPHSIAIGDLDGDGKLDLVTASNGEQGTGTTVSVLRNTSTSGTISFETKVDFTTGQGPLTVVVGDLDGDNKPDLAVTNFHDGAGSTVSVLRNTSTSGTVSFDPKVDFATGAGPYGAVMLDIDGDGKRDLAITNFGTLAAGDGTTVSVLRNTSAIGTIMFAAKVDVPTGTGPRGVLLADLEADGKADLVTTNFGLGGGGNTISVSQNTSSVGAISFAEKVDYITGGGPLGIVSSDLDADGKPDLTVTNYGTRSPNPLNLGTTISVFANTSASGAISFAPKVDFEDGIGPHGVAVGNLDQNTKPDLAIVNYGNGDQTSVSILQNTTGLTPEMNVQGNGVSISDGDTTPSTTDHTDFGSANIAGGIVDRTFTIQSLGTANLFLTGTPKVALSGSSDFSVTTQPSSPIAPSGSTTFVVHFDPSVIGTQAATISITNNDADENPYTFDIVGTGFSTQPEMNVQGNGVSISDGDTTPSTTDHIDFGSANIAGGIVDRTFTIENLGTANLFLTGTPKVALSGSSDFSVTTQPSSPIAPSGSTTFVVHFDPSAIGTQAATISITNNDADENPYTFDILGTGFSTQPEMNVQGNGVSISDGDTTPSTTDHTDFGSANIAGGIVDRTFTIENLGTANLTLTSTPKVTISGSSAFSVTTQPSSPVAPSGSTTFVVHFDPSVIGLYTATISLPDNDDDENPYTFDIQGMGVSNADTVGVFRPTNGLLYLKNSNDTGFADAALNYGLPGDYPVVGDWDGNGTVTIGIYRDGYFYLKNANTLGFAEIVFPFGNVGDQPIAGDWNGDGIDTIGIYRPSTGQFLLRNSNSEGAAEQSFYLGNVGDVGVAGDWNGDGIDTTGVFRPSNGVIFLKNSNDTGFADIALNYGLPGDRPVMGDWNDDGIDTIGIYRNGTFYLRNENTNGFAELIFGLGNPGDMPIAGDWDGLP